MIDRSYLPFVSARKYQDRKMAKWMGFFLSEHTSTLNKFVKDSNYVYLPPMQMDEDEIGQNLLEAFNY